MLRVSEELCVQCGECWRVCARERAIEEPDTPDGIPRITSHCNDCMVCVVACPLDAILPEGESTRLQTRNLQTLARKSDIKLPYQRASFDQFLAVARTRRVYRGFKATAVPDRLIRKILEAARWAPSAANQQPWTFVVVNEAHARRELADLYSRGVREQETGRFKFSKYDFMYQVPVFIVVCLDRSFKSVLSPAIDDVLKDSWLHEGIGALCQTIHLAAVSLGLGTGWITPLSVQLTTRIAELLGIPSHYEVFGVIPIGYPSAAEHRRYSAVWFHGPIGPIRREVEQMTHYNKFDPSKERDTNEYMTSLKRFQELNGEKRRLLEAN